MELLAELGAPGGVAQMLSVVFLPWLGEVRDLNDCVTCRWAEAGFPDEIDALGDELAIDMLRSRIDEAR